MHTPTHCNVHKELQKKKKKKKRIKCFERFAKEFAALTFYLHTDL